LNCGGEAHRPVDCETVTRWMKKKNSDFEITTTSTWIIANLLTQNHVLNARYILRNTTGADRRHAHDMQMLCSSLHV